MLCAAAGLRVGALDSVRVCGLRLHGCGRAHTALSSVAQSNAMCRVVGNRYYSYCITVTQF